MPKNPYLSAVYAAGYIATLVLVINFGSQFAKDKPETILIPMAMLSLFVLSAAMMGYLFIMQPLALYLDGKKNEAITFFVKTLATFAGITFVLLIVAFTVSMLL